MKINEFKYSVFSHRRGLVFNSDNLDWCREALKINPGYLYICYNKPGIVDYEFPMRGRQAE